MRENIASATTGPGTIDAALARAQVEGLLTQSGYYVAVENLFGAGFQSIIDGLFADYKKLLPELQFSDVSKARIAAIRDMSLKVFDGIGSDQATALQRELLNYSFGVRDQSSVFDEINTITSEFENTTALALDTAISGFEQETTNMLASDSGITDFEYVGPDDNVTRDFCAEHLGQVKTLEEWDQLDNGQIDPVSIYCGGYNCRHTLEPVIP